MLRGIVINFIHRCFVVKVQPYQTILSDDNVDKTFNIMLPFHCQFDSSRKNIFQQEGSAVRTPFLLAETRVYNPVQKPILRLKSAWHGSGTRGIAAKSRHSRGI